jgi:hypothetical protein
METTQVTERLTTLAGSTMPTAAYSSDTDSLEYALARTAFLGSLADGCVTFGIQRSLRDTFAHVIEMIGGVITDVVGACPQIWTLSRSLAYLKIDGTIFVKVQDFCHTSRDMWAVLDRNIYVNGYGQEKQIKALREKLAEIANQDFRVPKIIWHYITKGHRSTATIQLSQPKPVRNEYYPWISPGVSDYYNRFMQSEENILVLLGETGTGKTSFIRNLIWHSKWDAAFTYDEQLLAADDMFVDFLTNDVELMIIEDADLFLTNREHDGNKMMARFLNIGDGLFKSERTKKIIFTANLTQPDRIDNALLREGRCFDCMMFRPLSWDEATRAATVAEISLPSEGGRTYTLAQLFAKRRRIVPTFGFR